jgi:hypothetical protein
VARLQGKSRKGPGSVPFGGSNGLVCLGVVAQATEERVVSGAPVEREGDRLRCEGGRRDVIVSAETIHGELVGRLLMLDHNLCSQAGDGHSGDPLHSDDDLTALEARAAELWQGVRRPELARDGMHLGFGEEVGELAASG